MFWRLLWIFLGGFLLIALQYGFVSFLVFPFSSINIIYIVLLFSYFLSGKLEDVFMLALWSGFLKEFFNPTIFGLSSSVLLLSLYFTARFFEYFFTNRTLPSLLALNLFFLTCFHILFLFINAIASVKFNVGINFAFNEYFVFFIEEIIASTLVLLFLFFITNHFTRKLKNVFLFKST